MKHLLLSLACILALGSFAHAESTTPPSDETNMMEELDPFDPNIEDKLKQIDEDYQNETGLSPFLQGIPLFENAPIDGGCYRAECEVFALVDKSEQRLYLYVNGVLQPDSDPDSQDDDAWRTSTGSRGHETPNFDTRPNGRIYQQYSSRKFPGGDYRGLGNMPYAVFISGGFAIHGTPEGNYRRLGTAASHGCVRVHSENGRRFNEFVRAAGVQNTWITIQD